MGDEPVFGETNTKGDLKSFETYANFMDLRACFGARQARVGISNSADECWNFSNRSPGKSSDVDSHTSHSVSPAMFERHEVSMENLGMMKDELSK